MLPKIIIPSVQNNQTMCSFTEVSEWLKVRISKVCEGQNLPWVQIPPSPLLVQYEKPPTTGGFCHAKIFREFSSLGHKVQHGLRDQTKFLLF